MSKLNFTNSDVKHIGEANKILRENGYKLIYSSLSNIEEEDQMPDEKKNNIDRELFCKGAREDDHTIIYFTMRFASEDEEQ